MGLVFRFGFILILSMIALPAWGYDWVLDGRPVVLLKENNHDLHAVRSYLNLTAVDGRANIWVFFTDKGVFDKEGYDQRAASVFLTEKALARRAKVGRQMVTFGDLPVISSYIETIENSGGKLRRQSRWLNAASFSIPLDILDEIDRLPFVRKIEPVVVYRRINEPESRSFAMPSPSGLAGRTLLDYGNSLNQLTMINVPAIHERGFNGQGVLVAMFDTGFRKDHAAFAAAYGSGRVLAEWDFIFNDGNTQNEAEDIPNQHRHGTLTWSTLGGAVEGVLYGPAYGASFILAKTEDERSETMIEEDNWAAAVEWADSIGADVISSSLGYINWYSYSDLDGKTAVTTIAANIAASYGIVVVNSAGNEGNTAGSIIAPADAFDIISVGAVSSSRVISSFSSRGPTYDGRIKPEVCAQGSSTYCASPTDTNTYTTASGTSLSCPLVAGAAAALLSARPEFTPQNVRRALMETADRAENPNNTYGWGIIDLEAAFDWGALFAADTTVGQVPLEVHFYDSSVVAVTGRSWNFGDGATSTEVNPIHSYAAPGIYDVTLTVGTALGDLMKSEPAYIIALADTLTYGSDTVYAGESSCINLILTNSQPLHYLSLPIDFSDGIALILDSASNAGTRTAAFSLNETASDFPGTQRVFALGNAPAPLPPGSGPVLSLYFRTDSYAIGGNGTTLDSGTVSSQELRLSADRASYKPIVWPGEIRIRDIARGDANNDGVINVGDPVYLILYIFRGGPPPRTIESGDANMDFTINASDALFLINYIFRGGGAPADN